MPVALECVLLRISRRSCAIRIIHRAVVDPAQETPARIGVLDPSGRASRLFEGSDHARRVTTGAAADRHAAARHAAPIGTVAELVGLDAAVIDDLLFRPRWARAIGARFVL